MKIRPIHQMFQVSTGARLRPGSCEPTRPITMTARNIRTTGIWIAGWNHRLLMARASHGQRVSSNFQYSRVSSRFLRSNRVNETSRIRTTPAKKAELGMPGIRCT